MVNGNGSPARILFTISQDGKLKSDLEWPCLRTTKTGMVNTSDIIRDKYDINYHGLRFDTSHYLEVM